MQVKQEVYGLLAEYSDPEALVIAAERARQAGYRALDAYSPLPVPGLDAALGLRRTRLPWLVLAAGLMGGAGGYLLQYWISVVDYPLNVGGRPYHSWPSFVPVTFELTVLLAALAAVGGMLVANRLPRPHHPLFQVRRFERVSTDGFFLLVGARDPLFDPQTTRHLLQQLGAKEVIELAR